LLARLESNESSVVAKAVGAGIGIGLCAGLVPACIVGAAAGGVPGFLAYAGVVSLMAVRKVQSTRKRERTVEKLLTARKALTDAETAIENLHEVIGQCRQQLLDTQKELSDSERVRDDRIHIT